MPSTPPVLALRPSENKRLGNDINVAWERHAQIINGLLSFGDGVHRDNLAGNWVTVTTPGTPNTDFTVTHNLQSIPVGYLVMSKSSACDLYTGSVAATKTQITLRATVAGVVLVLFII